MCVCVLNCVENCPVNMFLVVVCVTHFVDNVSTAIAIYNTFTDERLAEMLFLQQFNPLLSFLGACPLFDSCSIWESYHGGHST